MTYGDFKTATKTNPTAMFLFQLWLANKIPLVPVMDLFEQYNN